MKVFSMIRAELARLTATTMSRIALIALLLVPVLYGGLYLWANQDPYAGLDRVPVALVVADTGADADGSHHNYGDEVADRLIDDGRFQWHRVTAEAAARGVADADFDFSVTLPADFSAALVSSATGTPRQATVTLTTNDTNSYLASTIGGQAAETIRTAIVKQVNEQAADRMLIGLADIRSSLVTATDGATRLTDAAGTAQEGSAQLADGAARLATGSQAVAEGAAGLNRASQQVAAGAAQLGSGARQLSGGVAQVSSGAAQVAAGNAALAAAADEAGSAAADALAALPQTRSSIQSQLQEVGLSQAQIDAVLITLDPVANSLTTDNDRLQSVVGQVDQLAAGSSQVAAGAAQLTPATTALADGAGRLADGAGQVSAGSQSLSEGATRAAVGARSLSTGAATLDDGLAALSAGTSQLRDGLQTGVGSIPDTDAATRTAQAKTIADPVDLRNTAVTSAGTYGAGLAPFFASLAAWIGIYALFLIVKPVSRRAITALHSPLKITLAGWLTPGLLGAVQMAGLFAILTGALKFEVHNPLGTYALMGLASLAFAAIILALNVWLGSVGQFLGLVLMVVQLVTAGGTFPWQTLPGPLASLHHLMPMSYAVDGIRQLMYGGNPATAWTDAAVLALWLAGGLVVAAIGVTRMTHFRTLRDLRPSLIG
ncbi:YhgE/Pip family protein [Glaciibacter sp. 2TAF33]|uniref:YhgE/Pip family protein n=1 Tax=Glaciibacter sp. 2TAF33 TaxID=3233015 RepID=UPI003F915CD9